MSAQGIVIQPEQGPTQTYTPGRTTVIKLTGVATGGSLMLFEQTIPAGTKSTFHRHHDGDEIAYVVSGELTFKIGDEVTIGGAGTVAFVPRGAPHAWKCTGAETARVVFSTRPPRPAGSSRSSSAPAADSHRCPRPSSPTCCSATAGSSSALLHFE